jgi:hypothetical protein
MPKFNRSLPLAVLTYRINFRRIANAGKAACGGAKIFSTVIQTLPQAVFGILNSTGCKEAVAGLCGMASLQKFKPLFYCLADGF